MKFPLCLFAAGLLAGGSAVAEEDRWQHTGVLYLVGASIDGKAGVGDVVADVDVDFGDILDNLEAGFMGAWRAERGPWAVAGDLLYMRLEQQKDGLGPAGNTRATVDADQVIVQVDGSRLLTERLSGYVGLRYWNLDVDVQVLGGGPLGENRAASGDENWVDPVIGLRHLLPINDRWQLLAKGDIGGFGIGSDFTWSATLLAGWNASEHATVFFGLRLIDVDYEDGSGNRRLLWDVLQGGPTAGFAWRF